MFSLDGITNKVYGMTKYQAHEKGICLRCKRTVKIEEETDINWKEYKISALCGDCFDELFQEL